MADVITFTPEQLALIEATGSTHVEACPGAGKTQCIVARFTRRVGTHPRRGVGLISFTNAVADEARLRCAGQTDLLGSPNFVGTIDSFINRLIVGPILNSEKRRLHIFHSSWKNVAGSDITEKGVAASARLDWFAVRIDGNATLDLRRVPQRFRPSMMRLEPWQRSKLESAAGQQWQRNIARGVLDANAARQYLTKYLESATWRPYLVDLMAARFHEIIVDEVQDCSAEDAALLQLLLDAELQLVLVGDPQQAIFGFRGNATSKPAKVLAKITLGTRLDGNFRSSTAIGTAVDSLRSAAVTDRAVGIYRDVSHPVRLLRYDKPKNARSQIVKILAECGIASSDLVVLAHANATARACAGAGSAGEETSTSRLVTLATAVHVIQDDTAPARPRTEALSRLGMLLHQTTPDNVKDLPIDEYLDTIGISGRAYREQCLRLAISMPAPYADKPSVFKRDLSAAMEDRKRVAWQSCGLKTPNGDKWKSKPSSATGAYKYSTVHGYKGLQSPAIALIIPKPLASVPADEDGLSQWTADMPGEARNVLYVGASRAEQLLIIAAHESIVDDVKRNLDRDSVIYE